MCLIHQPKNIYTTPDSERGISNVMLRYDEDMLTIMNLDLGKERVLMITNYLLINYN